MLIDRMHIRLLSCFRETLLNTGYGLRWINICIEMRYRIFTGCDNGGTCIKFAVAEILNAEKILSLQPIGSGYGSFRVMGLKGNRVGIPDRPAAVKLLQSSEKSVPLVFYREGFG